MSQKIIITGASGGLGAPICTALAAAGHHVVGTMRSTGGKNEAVAQALGEQGVHLVELDVTDDASVERGVEEAISYLGGLDVVFNNAGIGSYGLQELFTPEDMQRVFEVNVLGVQRVMRAVLPTLRAQGRGTVLYTSSLIGRIASPFYGTYSASKWALEAMAENYRTELSGFGIETCIVEPGAMPTAFLDGMLVPSDPDREAAYGDLARAVEPALAGLQQALEATPDQRPERVVEAVVQLLAMPYGEKPFRTVVDAMGIGSLIERYNAELADVTRDVHSMFGTEAMLSMNTPS